MARVNGFFGHIQKNHARSLIMFMGFMVAMHVTVAAILSIPFPFWPDFPIIFGDPIGYIREAGLYVTAFNACMFTLFYLANTFIIRISTGYKSLAFEANPRLHRITEELAMLAGIPTPKLGYMPVPALNSFASGLTKHDAHIIVTDGLLEALDDEELRAVIAHEIAHIKHGDMHMMTVASAATDSVKLINTLNPLKLSWLKKIPILIVLLFAPLFIPLAILAVLYSFIMQVTSLIANTTRYVISSSREFIADAEAVRLTHNPAALASALAKIHGRSDIYHMDTLANAMMIDGPASGKNASHPPMEDRIQSLINLSGSMIHGAGQRKDTRARSLRSNDGNAYGNTGYGGTAPSSSSFSQGFAATSRMNTGNVRDYIQSSPDYAQHQGATFKKQKSTSLVERMSEGNDGEFGLDRNMRYAIIALLAIFVTNGYFKKNSPDKIKPKSTYILPVLKQSPAFLALDLDGRGLHTWGLSGYNNSSHIYFDAMNTGLRHKTTWIDSSEGFLFLDKNHNKCLDNVSEMISTPYKTANVSRNIKALRKIDRNNDGVVDKKDSQFKHLMIWRDINHNGQFDKGEVFSLEKYGIASFNVKIEPFDSKDGRTLASRVKLLSLGHYTYDKSQSQGKGRYIKVQSINQKTGKMVYTEGRKSKRESGKMFLTSFSMDQTRYITPSGQKMVKSVEGRTGTKPIKSTLIKGRQVDAREPQITRRSVPKKSKLAETDKTPPPPKLRLR